MCTVISQCGNRKLSYDSFTYIYSRSNDPNGKALLAHALSIQNWIPLYKMDDCSVMLDYFYCVVYNLLDYYLPVRITMRHPTEKPWVNERFRRLIRQRPVSYTHLTLPTIYSV